MEVEFHEIIIAILSIAFGAWASVIVWFGTNIRTDLKQTNEELLKYIVQTEKRLAILETKAGLNNGKNHL